MRRDDGHPRMEITSFVGMLLEQDDVDAAGRRSGARQPVMETEVSTQLGAAPYEWSSELVGSPTETGNGPAAATPGRHDRSSGFPGSPAGAYSPSLLESRQGRRRSARCTRSSSRPK